MILVRRQLLFAEAPLLFELEELRVVALVLAQLPLAQRQDPVDGLVQQRQVVADHEHRAAEAFEFVEQPPLRRLVEVVGRFVEHHGLGLFVEHPHQVDASALTARERVEVLEQEVFFESESRGEARHLGLGLVTAELAELLLERGEAQDGLLGGVGRELVASVLHIGVEDVEPARREHVTQPDGLHAETAGHGLLGQVAQRALVADRARDAQVLGVITEQHRQERRLAGAVSTDQSHLLTVADGERDGVEDTSRTDLDSQISNYEHLAP